MLLFSPTSAQFHESMILRLHLPPSSLPLRYRANHPQPASVSPPSLPTFFSHVPIVVDSPVRGLPCFIYFFLLFFPPLSPSHNQNPGFFTLFRPLPCVFGFGPPQVCFQQKAKLPGSTYAPPSSFDFCLRFFYSLEHFRRPLSPPLLWLRSHFQNMLFLFFFCLRSRRFPPLLVLRMFSLSFTPVQYFFFDRRGMPDFTCSPFFPQDRRSDTTTRSWQEYYYS